MNNLTFGFIGLGLIGGSVARHLKKLDRGYTLIAYNRSINSLNEAKKDGIIDIICTEINDEFSKCDYIFLCLYTFLLLFLLICLNIFQLP